MGVLSEIKNAPRWRLRMAEAADAEALAQLGRDTFCETFADCYSDADLKAYLAKAYDANEQRDAILDTHIYNRVVELDGELVGYTKCGMCKLPIDTKGERAYELNRIYVRRACQGMGIGDALMQDALAQAEAIGADAIYLGMWEENHRARKFYARYEFVEVGEYVFYVGKQADRELILRRSLPRG